MVCPYCHKKIVSVDDHSYEDNGMDTKDVIVNNTTCLNNECDVETVIIYSKV